MLTARNVAHEFNGRPVLEQINLSVNQNQRLGLIGTNGAGKSTLLRILAGHLQPSQGDLLRPQSVSVGLLPQEVVAETSQTIRDYVWDSAADLRELGRRMRVLESELGSASQEELPQILAEYGEVSGHFEARGGYELAHRLEATLAGLKLSYLGSNRHVNTLSGGEKSRVALAALLVASPDVLLLDEPTNHLDDDSVKWLEDYLLQYQGGALLVTHDRDFLDAVATNILELDEDDHRIRRYDGNYEDYLTAKRAERRRLLEQYEREQDEIKELKEYTSTVAHRVGHGRAASDKDKRSFNNRGGRVERAVSRNVRTAQERLDKAQQQAIARPPDPIVIRTHFADKDHFPESIAQLTKVSVLFSGRQILDQLDLQVTRDSRLCVIGPNGSGKTTLLKVLTGELTPDVGHVWVNPSIRVGYLPQDPIGFKMSDSLLATFGGSTGRDSYDEERIATVMNFGLFKRADFNKQVGDLSVGQRRKIQLARLILSQPDFLVLDEPTNHLSLDAVEALENAMADFAGPIVTVTHDSRFRSKFRGQILAVEDGHLTNVVDLDTAYFRASASIPHCIVRGG